CHNPQLQHPRLQQQVRQQVQLRVQQLARQPVHKQYLPTQRQTIHLHKLATAAAAVKNSENNSPTNRRPAACPRDPVTLSWIPRTSRGTTVGGKGEIKVKFIPSTNPKYLLPQRVRFYCQW